MSEPDRAEAMESHQEAQRAVSFSYLYMYLRQLKT